MIFVFLWILKVAKGLAGFLQLFWFLMDVQWLFVFFKKSATNVSQDRPRSQQPVYKRCTHSASQVYNKWTILILSLGGRARKTLVHPPRTPSNPISLSSSARGERASEQGTSERLRGRASGRAVEGQASERARGERAKGERARERASERGGKRGSSERGQARGELGSIEILNSHILAPKETHDCWCIRIKM